MSITIKLIIIFVLIALWGGLMWRIWTPIKLTRVQVLKKAKKMLVKENRGCVCVSIMEVLKKYDFQNSHELITSIFPDLTFEEAEKAGFHPSKEYQPYWWDRKNMIDRIDFLDYLIDQHKDENQNLYEAYEKYLR